MSMVRVVSPHGYVQGNTTIYAGVEFDMERSTAEVMVRRRLVEVIGDENVKKKSEKKSKKVTADGDSGDNTAGGLSSIADGAEEPATDHG